MGRERERWLELRDAVRQVDARWHADARRLTYRTAEVVLVYLHAAFHDRPVSWACAAETWLPRDRPRRLPDQSTISRRTRTDAFAQFMAAVGARLAGTPPDAQLFKRVDGKPLPVAAHSRDRDATWGRGAGQDGRGYKLHALWARRPMPEQWAVAPLHVDERVIARRLLGRLSGGCGYVQADAMYDGNLLHAIAAAAGHQLVADRRRPGRGLGHRPHRPPRLRCIDLLEPPANAGTGFGAALRRQRNQIERDFGNLCGFGGGLHALPAWVRRIWRVRLWVHAKLLINAARIRVLRRGRAA